MAVACVKILNEYSREENEKMTKVSGRKGRFQDET
jgi:hypothetical protein